MLGIGVWEFGILAGICLVALAITAVVLGVFRKRGRERVQQDD